MVSLSFCVVVLRGDLCPFVVDRVGCESDSGDEFVDIISSPGGFSYVLHRSNFSVKFNSNKPNGLGVEGRRRPLEHNRERT